MSSITASGRSVVRFGAGVHKLDSLTISEDNVAIRGEGSDITVLEVPQGILIDGLEPRVSGLTLIGEGDNPLSVGLTLKNCKRALVEDVIIHSYGLQLKSLCEFGFRQWLHVYREVYLYRGHDGSIGVYDPAFRGAELLYTGDKVPGGGWLPGGEFSNTHTFIGGRIAVPGAPVLIDGPSATKMFGTYVDMQETPFRMTDRSPGLQMFGVHLDRNSHMRNLVPTAPCIVLEDPDFNRLKLFGQHPGLINAGLPLIHDGQGNPVDPTKIFLSPEGYIN